MRFPLALGALALVLAMGPAAALDPVAVPGSAAGGSDLYLVVDETALQVSAWQEANGLAGLQEAGTLLEDGTWIPPDSRLA